MEWSTLIYLLMTTKFISIIITVLTAVAPLSGQTYTVFSVIGNTKVVQGRQAMPLEPRKQLNGRDRLIIEAESAVTLLDEKNNKMYFFSSEGTQSVKELVEKASHRAKTISRQYMSYMVKQLFSKGSRQMSHPDTYMQVTAMSYRSASADSMLLSRLSQTLPQVVGKTAEEILCSEDNSIDGDMKVRFELVSCDTGRPITELVKPNTGAYVRVHNDTEEALYVNVLDIDQGGNKYLVLPVDSAASCAHLLVPPMSTVSFKSEPFIFSSDPVRETFILVATEEPVDFSILMNPIRRSSRKPMRVGFNRRFYQVK